MSATGGMTIGANGSVTGNGKIYANVTNGGLLAPGDSVGVLNIVNGSYTQTFSDAAN